MHQTGNFMHRWLSMIMITSEILSFSGYITAAEPVDRTQISQDLQAVSPNEFEFAQFTPPQGWRFSTSQPLPDNIQTMVVGKGQHEFPPSMNLGVEYYGGTLKDYLKVVKAINEAQGSEWKDLGTIRTEAGEASLSQQDMKTNWGDVREMHVILVKNGTVYILTAAALKEEFPKFYKDFFLAMRSLRITRKDLFEMVQDPKRRETLKISVTDLYQVWDTIGVSHGQESPDSPKQALGDKVFADQEFQDKYWMPFTAMVEKQYSDMGVNWKEYLLARTKKELLGRIK